MKNQYDTSFFLLKGKEFLMTGLFIIGILSGVLYAIKIRNNDIVFFTINQYMLSDTEKTLSLQTVKNSIILHGKQLIGMWACGLFNVTRIISYSLFFIIVFSYGLTITSFILMYGIKGILVSFFVCGIQAVIIIFIAMYIGHASILYTRKAAQNIHQLREYFLCLGIVIIAIALTGFLDGYLYSLFKPIINLLVE